MSPSCAFLIGQKLISCHQIVLYPPGVVFCCSCCAKWKRIETSVMYADVYIFHQQAVCTEVYSVWPGGLEKNNKVLSLAE